MNIQAIVIGLAAVVLLWGSPQLQADDEKAMKDQIVAIDKELAPIRKKATADPEVKAAADALKAAQERHASTLEAAMIRADPKAKELLDQKKKLLEELAAARKAAKQPPPAKTK